MRGYSYRLPCLVTDTNLIRSPLLPTSDFPLLWVFLRVDGQLSLSLGLNGSNDTATPSDGGKLGSFT